MARDEVCHRHIPNDQRNRCRNRSADQPQDGDEEAADGDVNAPLPEASIAAEYYETRDDVGYVVLDADASSVDSHSVLADIRSLEGTIRAATL